MTRARNRDQGAIDATIFCECLAERLRSKGLAHPVAAAVALVARGHRRVDAAPFAAAIGLDERVVREVEAGAVAFADLPDQIAIAFAEIASASLFLMADYDERRARTT